MEPCGGEPSVTLVPQKSLLSACFLSPRPTEICAADCGGHGVCVGGTCRCEDGWMGAACDQRACHPRCAEHGTCRDGKCECSPGWNGEHCTIGTRAGPGLPGGCTLPASAGHSGGPPLHAGAGPKVLSSDDIMVGVS